MKNLKNKIAQFLYRAGFSADFVTGLGLLFAFAAAALIYECRFFWAGAALVVSGIFDLLDGEIARVSGKQSKFGGVLDSALDRYGDGVVFGALVIYFAARGQLLYAGLALSALLGSFSISYVRARAECEVDSCRIGFWERGERITYLALGLLFNNVRIALWVLGIFTHVTVFQRIHLAKRLLVEGSSAPPALKTPFSSPRSAVSYWAKAAFWIFFLLFSRS